MKLQKIISISNSTLCKCIKKILECITTTNHADLRVRDWSHLRAGISAEIKKKCKCIMEALMVEFGGGGGGDTHVCSKERVSL